VKRAVNSRREHLIITYSNLVFKQYKQTVPSASSTHDQRIITLLVRFWQLAACNGTANYQIAFYNALNWKYFIILCCSLSFFGWGYDSFMCESEVKR
jgi:hypothetical protein